MSDFLSLPPAARFACIMAGMLKAIADSGGRQPRPRGLAALAVPLLVEIWNRLRRMTIRFAGSAARHALNPHPAPRRSRAMPEDALQDATASAVKPCKPRPEPALPRHFAWLMAMMPESACGASQLRYFLNSADVKALLVEAPQLGRILRPLCHMLGIKPADVPMLYPPPPPAPPEAPPSEAPPDASAIPGNAPPHAPPIAITPPATPPPPDPPPPIPTPPAPAPSAFLAASE